MEPTLGSVRSDAGVGFDGSCGRNSISWERSANETLKEAMVNERSKRWTKVVNNYKELLLIFYRVTPSEDKERPAWLTLLLYECHYHLGVALQQIDQHKKAAHQFSQAIRSVCIPRNGCMEPRCRLSSCLMTPIYARRAFAHARSGDLKNALFDAEKAVVSDSNNPDVYCIRALVNNSKNKTLQAVEDVRKALRLNPQHVCALILQGRMKEKSTNTDGSTKSGQSSRPLMEEHVKACSLNPDSHHFLTVDNFLHEKIIAFYDKFLYSLSVPHTISSVVEEKDTESGTNRSEGKMMKKKMLIRTNSSIPRPAYASQIDREIGTKIPLTQSAALPLSGQDDQNQESCSGSKQRHQQDSEDLSRTKVNYNDQTTAKLSLNRRKAYGQAVSEGNKRPTRETIFVPLEKSQQLKKSHYQKSCSVADDEVAKQTPMTTPDGLQIFQEINVSDVPRMYYRPWNGDKLPVTEVEKKLYIYPPFKV